jgi:hypothetical protein
MHDCAQETAALVARRAAGESGGISDLYKDERFKRVWVSDAEPFYGKCAYCESRIIGNQPGDIEHFRPKGRVTDAHGNVITITRADGTSVPHPGYYWLACDWRNLLYACADCNRPSSFKTGGIQVGKWDKFPVVGLHAFAPGDEVNEQPLLLNPIIDTPEEHISIDESGILASRTARGQVSIDVLGLNARESLIKERLEAIGDTTTAVMALAVACTQRNNQAAQMQLAKLRDAKSGRATFSLARRFALSRARNDLAPCFAILNPEG